MRWGASVAALAAFSQGRPSQSGDVRAVSSANVTTQNITGLRASSPSRDRRDRGASKLASLPLGVPAATAVSRGAREAPWSAAEAANKMAAKSTTSPYGPLFVSTTPSGSMKTVARYARNARNASMLPRGSVLPSSSRSRSMSPAPSSTSMSVDARPPRSMSADANAGKRIHERCCHGVASSTSALTQAIPTTTVTDTTLVTQTSTVPGLQTSIAGPFTTKYPATIGSATTTAGYVVPTGGGQQGPKPNAGQTNGGGGLTSGQKGGIAGGVIGAAAISWLSYKFSKGKRARDRLRTEERYHARRPGAWSNSPIPLPSRTHQRRSGSY